MAVRQIIPRTKCTPPFSTSTCDCSNCKSKFASGTNCTSICICKTSFNQNSLHFKLCRPCRSAFEGHGHHCCEWKWLPTHTAKKVVQQPTSSYIRPDAECTETMDPNTPEVVPEKVLTEREQEHARRLKLCIELGMVPANERVRFLQCTPEQDLLYGPHGPPWDDKGNIKPEAVPYGNEKDIGIDTSQKITDYSTQPRGWNCKLCNNWVNYAPRAFRGPGSEPPNWWWCPPCREKSKSASSAAAAQETSSRKRLLAAAAQGSGSIAQMFSKVAKTANFP